MREKTLEEIDAWVAQERQRQREEQARLREQAPTPVSVRLEDIPDWMTLPKDLPDEETYLLIQGSFEADPVGCYRTGEVVYVSDLESHDEELRLSGEWLARRGIALTVESA